MQSLTSKQLQVIEALSTGLSVTAAADAAGLHRTTVHHWSRNIPEFRDTLAAVKQAHIDIARDEMNSLAAPAIAILRNIIEDQSASPALRVRTALAIIKFVTTPEKSPSPKDAPFEQLLDGAYLAGYKQAQERAAAATSPEETGIHHNSSLSTTVEAGDESTAHQTPRNALCPCGSKLKFKRCCGKNAPPVLGRAA
ncbi:MAG: SEC-C domain-containing protein [Acidobacteria bacterium]|nr:SEC-C domain-containing protein [Acidobacteriota bacterium]